jgi:Ca2+-binding RTX toxin-like protein
MTATRRLALAFAAIGVAVLLATGVALAATIHGTAGNDTLKGTSSADSLYGYGGDDSLEGLEGADGLLGGSGVDIILGGPGSDEIDGESGNDNEGNVPVNRRFGGLYGGLGVDELDGDAGDDRIIAVRDGTQADTITGGSDNDFIDVSNKPAAKDLVSSCGSGYDKVTKDTLDSVASDCEDVKTPEQRAQQARQDFANNNTAVTAFERNMSVGSDGKLKLDKEGLAKEKVNAKKQAELEEALDKTEGTRGGGEREEPGGVRRAPAG